MSCLRKYFLSYLFIFTIPVLILGILMYRNTVTSLQQEIEAGNIYKLHLVQEATDRRMEELDAIAHLIAGDPQLSPAALNNPVIPETADNAMHELKRYTMLNIGLEDIVLYYRGQGSVYTSNGVSTPEHLADQIYQLEGWNSKQLLQDMDEISKVTIRSTEEVSPIDSGSQKLLTYMFPITSGDSPPYGTVMFLIRESVLTRQIDTILNDLQGKAYILDENKTVLASKGALPGLNAADINRLLDEMAESGITQTRVRDQSYSVNQVTSDNSGWSFVTIMPTRQFLERAIEMRTFVLVMLLFVILIGIVAAVVLSSRTYRPIRMLGDRNERLATQIDAQRPMMREHFLLTMLRGVWTDDEEIAELMKKHEMEMNGPFFFVMLVSLGERRKDITAVQHEKIEQVLEKVTFDGDGVGYGVELVHDNAFALAINLAGSDSDLRERQKEAALAIIKLMQRIGIRVPSVSIGRRYLYSKHFNRSFIEASVAKRYEVPGEYERLLFFDEIKPLQDQVSWYPLGDQVKLSLSLKQGDAAVALETLHAMIGSIGAREQSILLLRCMGYDVVNTVFKTLGEMKITEHFPRIKQLLEFQSLEQLEEQLASLVVEICDQVNQARDNRQVMLGNEILDYIGQHYRSYEISLEHVANRFNLSVSYIGRLLKEQTGETFTEYVARLRMNEVKRALVETDQPIKDIIVSVGLLDASNFIRKFRKSEGITPGEFRRRSADS